MVMKRYAIAVTGGSGLLGKFVVAELMNHGHDVTVLDLQPPAHGIAYSECNILDLTALRSALRGKQCVIHLAGIDDGNDFPSKDYFETNVQGAWNVLHAAESVGVEKVVVASSTATLGLGFDRPPDYLPVDEAHPLRPSETYSLTKQVIESVCASYVRRGDLRVICLRPTLVVRPEREHAILSQLALPEPDKDTPADIVLGAEEGPYGGLSATRTYVRSADCARCFRLALDYHAEPFDVFNVAACDTIGRVQTLARYQKIFGQVPQVRRQFVYDNDAYASTLDTSRARAALGWQAKGDWRDVVKAHQTTSK
jgi:UDP-glucose 4-epimerase